MKYAEKDLLNSFESFLKTCNEELIINGDLYLKETDELKKNFLTFNLNTASLLFNFIDLAKQANLKGKALETFVINLSLLMHLIFDDENFALEYNQNSFKAFKLGYKLARYSYTLEKILSKNLKVKVRLGLNKISYHELSETSKNFLEELKKLA